MVVVLVDLCLKVFILTLGCSQVTSFQKHSLSAANAAEVLPTPSPPNIVIGTQP